MGHRKMNGIGGRLKLGACMYVHSDIYATKPLRYSEYTES